MRIEVTAEDINCGVAQDGDACPIARAVIRATGVDDVFVDEKAIWFGNSPAVWLPPEAEAFVKAFDGGAPVEPITFEVKL